MCIGLCVCMSPIEIPESPLTPCAGLQSFFEFGRQREPKLEALDARHVIRRRHFLAVADAAAGAHPFHATIGDRAGADGRIVVARKKAMSVMPTKPNKPLR